jgi:hypothetical protein
MSKVIPSLKCEKVSLRLIDFEMKPALLCESVSMRITGVSKGISEFIGSVWDSKKRG